MVGHGDVILAASQSKDKERLRRVAELVNMGDTLLGLIFSTENRFREEGRDDARMTMRDLMYEEATGQHKSEPVYWSRKTSSVLRACELLEIQETTTVDEFSRVYSESQRSVL